MSIEIYKFTVYSCGCGYTTSKSSNASKHKKISCGHEISIDTKNFVLETDHLKTITELNNHHHLANATTVEQTVNGDHAYIDNSTDNSTNITNITLVLPERTTKEDFVEYLETMDRLGFRTPEQVASMPGKMLMLTRDAKKVPGALIERNKKIIEKLPDGSERIMGKKKAVRTYTHEAVDALCLRPPADGVTDFLETDRGSKRTRISVQDAAKLRATDSVAFHHEVPACVKTLQQKMESHTENFLDKITTENKTNGFL
jgi:hypothetical protein